MKRRLLPTLLGLAIVLALALLRLADAYPVQSLRETTFDLFQRLGPRPPADYPVKVVDIDEASLKAVGQWPWPRDVMAKLTDRITELGAAVVTFDVLFPEPDRSSPSRIAADLLGGLDAATLPDHDALFAAALTAAPSVLGFAISPDSPDLPQAPKAGIAISGSDPSASVPLMPGAVLPIDALSAAATGLGAFSLNSTDAIGVVRRLPLLWSNGTALFPALAIEALRVASGESTIVVLGEEGGNYVEGLRVGPFSIPTTGSGDFWLHYRSPIAGEFIPAATVLGPDYRALADSMAGQIVIIGSSASGLNDLRGTPLGDNVPGVSIHAQAIEQIIAQDFLVRSDWMAGLEVVALLVGGLAVIAAVLFAGPLVGLLAGLVALVAIAGGAWWAFVGPGWLIDPSFALVGIVVTFSAMGFLRYVVTDAERRKIRRAFGHYVAPSLLAQIERSSDRLKLGGEVRELTIMFTDVRDFTKLSQSVDPVDLVHMLNVLFGALGDEITREFGTIDKFVGDAIMAFWNAPLTVDGHAEKACRSALAMRRALEQLNAADAFGLRRSNNPRSALAMGIGISTGDALVGNMGLESRFDYSCVGDAVNLAARVEGACRSVGYDILVTGSTRDLAPGLAYLEAGSIALKGIAAPTPIHLLVGDETLAASGPFLMLRERHGAALAVLESGGDAGAILAETRAAAAFIDPRLADFYDLALARREDSRTFPAEPALA